jgi:hypothetical protein
MLGNHDLYQVQFQVLIGEIALENGTFDKSWIALLVG